MYLSVIYMAISIYLLSIVLKLWEGGAFAIAMLTGPRTSQSCRCGVQCLLMEQCMLAFNLADLGF